MHINWAISLGGLIVGFVIGLTGMGGGALMTPMLVLIFGVKPTAAVSSDLVASLIMKPFGAAVHLKRGTVNWRLVGWLVVSSVPCALAGVFIIHYAGNGKEVQDHVQTALGIALLLAAAAVILKLLLDTSEKSLRRAAAAAEDDADLVVRPIPTMAIGALGGVLVGMTSTGSGTVIIVGLMTLYPMLRLRRMVGTDLMQAIPLVGAAALGHIIVGELELGITASLIIGSIPGVLLGARLSSRAPDLLVRPVIAVVLVGTSLKLLKVPTTALGITLACVVAAGLPLLLWRLRNRPDASALADARTPVAAGATYGSEHGT